MTSYEIRIRGWSSDVCSSVLALHLFQLLYRMHPRVPCGLENDSPPNGKGSGGNPPGAAGAPAIFSSDAPGPGSARTNPLLIRSVRPEASRAGTECDSTC